MFRAMTNRQRALRRALWWQRAQDAFCLVCVVAIVACFALLLTIIE